MDFPKELEDYKTTCDIVDIRNLKCLLGMRDRFSHKGDFGHVLVVGGSIGFGGAPALASLAALRTGSGLVSAALPASLVCGPIARLAPEAMAHPIEENHGFISEKSFLTWLFQRKRFDVLAIGPGLGQSPDTSAIITALLKMAEQPLVLDADALNLIATNSDAAELMQAQSSAPRILTPHHAEAARLLGIDISEVISDRLGSVKRLAKEYNSIVVLKGHGTLIATPNCEKPFISVEGNPGMATGGAGDVLTGIIASLLGQGLSPVDAAIYGASLHGFAGDLAAKKFGEQSMISRDIIDALPEAFQAIKNS